jgi:hypothetical protein
MAMSSGPTVRSAKSPLGAAILISLAIAAASVLSALDAPIFDEITSGRWLTRPFSEAQERHAAAIAKLERNVGAVTTDIDFVTSRMDDTIKRNEDLARDRFAEMDARITALNERILQASVMARAPEGGDAADVTGLRTSLHELTASHKGAVAAITRRLDRIEVMVGMSTDVISSNEGRARRHMLKNLAAHSEPQISATTEQAGHIFDVKPVSQQAPPLRLSRLRD